MQTIHRGPRDGIARRRFLSTAAMAVAGATVLPRTSPARTSADTPAKNIIFLVSDGMSTGVLGLAESFSHLVRGTGTHWMRLANKPATTTGLQQTASRSSMVTDSAAASSAWASGRAGFNGALNYHPDGTRLTPIGRLVKERGKQFGLVTTATVTHATPAGFAANEKQRNNELSIAPQYLNLADVILGGGRDFFLAESRKDGRDLMDEFVRAGYLQVPDRGALVRVADRSRSRLLGLFAPLHLPYTVDAAGARVPTLAEMSRAALGALAGGPEGFLLQIEGARIDHAAHNNDAAGLLREQLAFDDALGVALDFARDRDDTLVVVTTDHGNANPGLNGLGPGYKTTDEHFKSISHAKASHEAVHSWVKRQIEAGTASAADLAEGIRVRLGFLPAPREVDVLVAALGPEPAGLGWSKQLSGFHGLLGQIAGNHNGIGWCGVSHTADPVLIHTTGPRSGLFGGVFPIHGMFDRLCEAMGFSFSNPEPASAAGTSSGPQGR